LTDVARVASRGTIDAIDVTPIVDELVPAGASGTALVRLPHTSAALVLGPSDEGMLEDFLRMRRDWLAGLRPFRHVENDNPNGEAHLLSSILGVTLLVPLRDGRLDLGTWQRIILLEFDGPAQRTIELRLL
jgi:secondary thiamine-phosphate synthase enzyme